MALERRLTFGEDAALYDRVRPAYPERIFDDLEAITGLGPGARVLEVGCGTGRASVPLARRGFRLEAVDPSPPMAQLARRKLRGFPGSRVVIGDFETQPAPPAPFDLVVAAAAFHWIDPTVRYRKAAAMLREEGWLAIIDTHHVAGGSMPYFEESQRWYRRYFPATAPDFRLPSPDAVPLAGPALERSGFFRGVVSRTYPWEATYAVDEYLDLLRTYSDHRSLGPARREALLAGLGRLIRNRFGGKVTKAHITELTVGSKLPTDRKPQRRSPASVRALRQRRSDERGSGRLVRGSS